MQALTLDQDHDTAKLAQESSTNLPSSLRDARLSIPARRVEEDVSAALGVTCGPWVHSVSSNDRELHSKLLPLTVIGCCAGGPDYAHGQKDKKHHRESLQQLLSQHSNTLRELQSLLAKA